MNLQCQKNPWIRSKTPKKKNIRKNTKKNITACLTLDKITQNITKLRITKKSKEKKNKNILKSPILPKLTKKNKKHKKKNLLLKQNPRFLPRKLLHPLLGLDGGGSSELHQRFRLPRDSVQGPTSGAGYEQKAPQKELEAPKKQ